MEPPGGILAGGPGGNRAAALHGPGRTESQPLDCAAA
jgi:hypothetical protein